ncbi:surface-adhesin E family protein [Burkholderia sp. 572]|uniref:surface-adhesin E family protein n=1 Tax=Burkholderia sp. 572 TaxID=3156414 RepID=UPI00339AEB37
MNKKYLAFAVCGLFLCSVAQATDWRTIADNGTYSLAFDPSSIRHLPDGRTKAWFLKSFAEEKAAEGAFIRQPYRSAKELEIFDCKQGTFAVGMVIYYTGESGKGATAGMFQPIKAPAPEDMFEVVPGSASESMFNAGCPSKRKASM